MINTLKSAALGAALAIGLVGTASAQELNFFTIGTGGTAYTYYPVGGVIANAIS
ncbi:MAG: TAXI family TRAP transporter solute-binding subunit, partial [Rhodobacterales bacterium]